MAGVTQCNSSYGVSSDSFNIIIPELNNFRRKKRTSSDEKNVSFTMS